MGKLDTRTRTQTHALEDDPMKTVLKLSFVRTPKVGCLMNWLETFEVAHKPALLL